MDAALVPFPDQWAFFASVQRMEKERVSDLVRAAESRGRVVGLRLALPDENDDAEQWKAPPPDYSEMAH